MKLNVVDIFLTEDQWSKKKSPYFHATSVRFENENVGFFEDFQDEIEIMMADLKSASKMRWTIREDFSIWLFFLKKIFVVGIFDDFSLQKPEKKIFCENIWFFKISSRMVHLIFDADFKSAIIVFILSWKSLKKIHFFNLISDWWSMKIRWFFFRSLILGQKNIYYIELHHHIANYTEIFSSKNILDNPFRCTL